MRASELPIGQVKLITPRALRNYVEGLGWQKVEGVNGNIAAYRSPISMNTQILLPLDEQLDDYEIRTAEAVLRLSQFQNRPVQEVLDQLAIAREVLASRPRSLPQPKSDHFVGYVEELRGGPTPADSRPSGEIRLTLFDQEAEIHAKVELGAEDYALAGQAHLASQPIMVSGILHRLPQLSQIESIQQFGLVRLNPEESIR